MITKSQNGEQVLFPTEKSKDKTFDHKKASMTSLKAIWIFFSPKQAKKIASVRIFFLSIFLILTLAVGYVISALS